MRDRADDPLAGHLARLLLLIEALSDDGGHVRALSAIARHDFLLRYPRVMAAVLAQRDVELPPALRVRAAEEQAVEATMLRYKYGPWDHRYYPLVGRLVARGFVDLDRVEKPIELRISRRGADAAASLESPLWHLVRGRCALLAEHLHVTGYELGKLIEAALAE